MSTKHVSSGATPEAASPRVQRALKMSTLFARASRATRDAIAATSVTSVTKAGGVVLRQGEAADFLLLICRGRARTERATREGHVSVPLAYRDVGDVLGESSCLGREETHAEGALAVEDVEVARIPRHAIEARVSADVALGSAVLALLLARQREIEARIGSLLLRNVEGRLAEFLVDAADRWGVPSPQGLLISAPLTHLEIARSIGSTRETVTLTLGALRRDGLLDVSGRRLIVRDREALAAR